MASPICLVNMTSTVNGVNVTAASTVTIKLNSSAGVGPWSIQCVNTDETNTAAAINATMVIDLSTFTATFTAPAAGSALIFESKINNGKDINGNDVPSYTTTFGVFVLTVTSLRVGAFAEGTEGDATYGWTSKLNSLIRNFTGSATAAGDGLTYSAGVFNVGQNADNTIKVNPNDIQINPTFYSQAAVASTLVQRSAANAITVGQVNCTSVNNSGSTTIGTTLSVTGSSTLTGQVLLGNASVSFISNVVSPTFSQANNTTASATGQNLAISAQTCTGPTSTGGSLNLIAGTGTSTNGYVNIYAGSAVLVASFGSTGISMNKANITFGSIQASNPTISQLTASSNVATNSMNITAQAPFASATGANRTPGSINLNLAAPTGGGTTRGAVVVKDNSNTVMSFAADNSGNGVITVQGAATFQGVTSSTFLSGGDTAFTVNNAFSVDADSIRLTNQGSGPLVLEDSAGTGIELNSTGGGYLYLNGPGDFRLKGESIQIDPNFNADFSLIPNAKTGAVTGTHFKIFGGNTSGGSDTGGNVVITPGTGSNFNGQIGLFSSPSHTPAAGGGANVLYIGDCSAAPSTNPTSGHTVYSESGNHKIRCGANTVTLGNKPSVTGSRGGNNALASLLTVLATAGIITDSTSA